MSLNVFFFVSIKAQLIFGVWFLKKKKKKKKGTQMIRGEKLGEDTNELIYGRDRVKKEKSMKSIMMNEMTINLNVLYLFMENFIMNNLNSIFYYQNKPIL